MDTLLLEVNWLALIVGAVAAFGLGWAWYSDMLFGERWREGIGISPDDTSSMMWAMAAQAFGTFFLAWVIAVAETFGSLQLVILLALTIGTIIKANGLFTQKSHYAIGVEVGYIWLMVIVMVLTHGIL